MHIKVYIVYSVRTTIHKMSHQNLPRFLPQLDLHSQKHFLKPRHLFNNASSLPKTCTSFSVRPSLKIAPVKSASGYLACWCHSEPCDTYILKVNVKQTRVCALCVCTTHGYNETEQIDSKYFSYIHSKHQLRLHLSCGKFTLLGRGSSLCVVSFIKSCWSLHCRALNAGGLSSLFWWDVHILN